jgi:uncharacterized membrane protein YhaH (DUF805 family)
MVAMTNDPYAVDREPPEDAPVAGPTFVPPAPQPVAPVPAPAEPQQLRFAPTEPAYEFGAPTFDPQHYGAQTHGYQPDPQQQAARFYQAPGYGADQDHPAVRLAPLPTWYGRPIIDDPNGPDAPLKGANPVEAYVRFWRRGFTFSGRASRAEYWWAGLANILVLFSGAIVTAIVSSVSNGAADGVGILVGLYFLAALVPSIAVTVRRLHDTNNSGGLAALALIPYIGSLIVAILCVFDSKAEGARFDQINKP